MSHSKSQLKSLLGVLKTPNEGSLKCDLFGISDIFKSALKRNSTLRVKYFIPIIGELCDKDNNYFEHTCHECNEYSLSQSVLSLLHVLMPQSMTKLQNTSKNYPILRGGIIQDLERSKYSDHVFCDSNQIFFKSRADVAVVEKCSFNITNCRRQCENLFIRRIDCDKLTFVQWNHQRSLRKREEFLCQCEYADLFYRISDKVHM